MSHHKHCSALVSIVQDEVFIRSILYKFGAHIINIKYLVSKFESTQQDRVSKNENNMIKNSNQHQIPWWASAIL